MKVIEAEIVEMRKTWRIRQEIAEHFGLSKKQIVNGLHDTIKHKSNFQKGYCQEKEAVLARMDNHHTRMKWQN